MDNERMPAKVRLTEWLGLAAVAALLCACTRSPENALADEKVLCDPLTGDAFFVRPGAGDTSFIRPNRSMAGLCKKA